jgi:CheY-like chemotaxis protein
LVLRFNRPKEPHLLVADASRLQQVLWNLLSNAVKFSDPGGQIEVELGQAGSQLVVAVTDQGRGIELDFLPYVFDRFKQADGSTTRRYGGLGLGLAIVRHIVELHGGSARVHSAGPGQGSRFEISLPVRATTVETEASAASEREAQTVAETPTSDLNGVRVLVLDDERDARDLLELVLTRAGATVVKASSAAEAMQQLEHFEPDVIVSDIGMPNEDGYSFMQRVRATEAHRHVQSIALTAYARGEDRQQALRAGFSTHLGKPVDPGDLTAAVSRLIRN